MSVEHTTIAVLATGAGFAVVLGMGLKLALSLWFAASVRHETAEYLELFVNGKDYSVDLRSIGNGGSTKLRKAVEEVERCSEIA